MKKYNYGGIEYSLTDLSKLPECVVSRETLRGRLRNNWDVRQALTQDPRPRPYPQVSPDLVQDPVSQVQEPSEPVSGPSPDAKRPRVINERIKLKDKWITVRELLGYATDDVSRNLIHCRVYKFDITGDEALLPTAEFRKLKKTKRVHA